MAVLTKKFSEFPAGAESDSASQYAGLEGSANVRSTFFKSWTTAGRPTSPYTGQFGYNTTAASYEFYNGSVWASIDDDTTPYLPLVGGTMTGDIVMGANKITSTYVPVSGPDLTNKTYVDSVASASPLTTKGDLYTYAAADARLGVGSDGEILFADSAESTGLKWDAVPVSQANVQNNSFTYAVDSSGAANTVTVALSPALTAYADGQSFWVKIANTNTGNTNINVNSLGDLDLLCDAGEELLSGALVSGDFYQIVVDNTNSQARVVDQRTIAVEAQGFYNGAIKEGQVFTVSSDGANITAQLDSSPVSGQNLSLFYSSGISLFGTPDTVTLTAGTDTVPIKNYVFIPESTKTLTANTTGFPSAEHTPVGTCVCQTAASMATQGAYAVHAWTDHIVTSNDQGHLADLNYWIRQQSATWQSGVAATITDGAATFDVSTTAGVVLQLHPHAMPAFDTSGASFVLVPNDNGGAYTQYSNLTTILTDESGGTLSGKYYNLVLWGVVSEDTGDCQLMVNVPTGSYNNSSNALDDVDNTAVFTIPGEFRGVGFLIARICMRNQSGAAGTFTEQQTFDLRGLVPATASGSGIGGISAVEDDPNPKLGGNLNLNSFSIVAPSVNISDFLDDDTFATASATTGATSESIKAYVDNNSGSAGSLFMLMGG